MFKKVNLFIGLFFLGVSLVFYFIPSWDIKISNFFYNPITGFNYNNNSLIKFIFRTVPNLTFVYVAVLVYKILSFICNNSFQKTIQHPAMILLLSCALGPGLIVNYSLKDHYGRARPKQIEEFDGPYHFTKVYEISNQCIKNCSFSSGHAAMAFNFSSIAYIASTSKQFPILTGGIIFGLIVGLGRIMQGGHFASDIIVSGAIMFLLNSALFYLHTYYIKSKNKENKLL